MVVTTHRTLSYGDRLPIEDGRIVAGAARRSHHSREEIAAA